MNHLSTTEPIIIMIIPEVFDTNNDKIFIKFFVTIFSNIFKKMYRLNKYELSKLYVCVLLLFLFFLQNILRFDRLVKVH